MHIHKLCISRKRLYKTLKHGRDKTVRIIGPQHLDNSVNYGEECDKTASPHIGDLFSKSKAYVYVPKACGFSL